MIDGKKRFMGTYPTQVEAGKAYDISAILIHGIKAKTNFDYTAAEIRRIIKASYDV